MYNGEMLFADRETRTLWSLSAGLAMDGPLVGARMEVVSLLQTTWAQWRELNPETKVLSSDTPYKGAYKPLPPPRTTLSAGLQRTLTGVDDRLPPMEQILALEASGRHRAYPLAAVAAAAGVVNEVVSDIPVVVLMDRHTRAMTAFRRTVDGRTLNFEPAEGGAVARDRETGSLWRIDGIATSGPLKTLKLAPVNFHVGAWYSWVAYFPDTTLYGR